MPGSSTCNEYDSPGFEELLFVVKDARKDYFLAVGNHPAADTVLQGFRLLIDFLEHEMVETAFLQLGYRHFQFLHGDLAVLSVQIHDMQRLTLLNDRDLIVFQVHEILRVVNDGRSVGGEEIFPIAYSYGHGTALPGGDDARSVSLFHNGNRIGPDNLFQRDTDSLFQAAFFRFADIFYQIHQHFRVSAAAEGKTIGPKGIPEYPEILYYSIMDKSDFPGTGKVRMGIYVIRLAVRSPAGVPYAYGPAAILPREECFQAGNLAFALVNVDYSVRMDYGHSGAVVSSVFQTVKTLDDDRTCLTLTYITYYSTHGLQG